MYSDTGHNNTVLVGAIQGHFGAIQGNFVPFCQPWARYWTILGLISPLSLPKVATKGPPKAPWVLCNYIPTTVNHLGAFRSFWAEKGVKLFLKMASISCSWRPNEVKFAPNGPKMAPKCPHQHCIVIVSNTVHYLGTIRSFWATERDEIDPKMV